MRTLPLLAGILAGTSLAAQKPPIDTTAFSAWTQIGDAAISPDGAYFLYSVRESYGGPATVILQARQTSWRRELHGTGEAAFSDDSRRAVVRVSGDSLCLITLGTSTAECIPEVGAFRLFKQGLAEWLAYQRTSPARELVLRNLAARREQTFTGVAQYAVSDGGNTLVLVTESGGKGRGPQSVSWIGLEDGRRTTIWEGREVGTPVLDSAGTRLAFMVHDAAQAAAPMTLWYYRAGTERARPLNRLSGLEPGWHVEDVSKVTGDGRLLVTLGADSAQRKPGAVSLDVWSYTDGKLQSQQLMELAEGRWYQAVVLRPESQPRVLRLQQEQESVQGEVLDEFVVVDGRRGHPDEAYWNRDARPAYALVSTRDGTRRPIPFTPFSSASPGGRYVVGADAAAGDIWTYEVPTGITRNLTRAIPGTLGDMLTRDHLDRPMYRHYRGFSFATWSADGEGLLIYDEFDIWWLDPDGKKAPVNVTNGYGRRHGIELRLAGMRSGIYAGGPIRAKSPVIITGFDRATKQSGFYRVTLGRAGDPERLSMGPYHYDAERIAFPLKASDAEVYLVQRESATESPNLFWTTDFKTLKPVSAVYPERRYNWLTTELLEFKTLDGRTEQGVLYKPENFDSTLKYPVILHYYERLSEEMYVYPRPGWGTGGDIDKAWFVSRGYLVFTPDIHYRIGEPGPSAYNSIVGAAEHLRRFPWVDAAKLGLQGHSFGGYETNYVVTHTDLFAAAVSSSGPVDLISNYGSLWGDGRAEAGHVEVQQLRMGATPWQRQDLYLKNSPIFQVDKVTTPLLTVSNKQDSHVSFSQGLELFLALRRLGKRGWMLQYDEGGHGLHGKDFVDYTVRMTQFFDHYLKGAPPARWMTRGIPAARKGIDDGLALDREIATPGPGLVSEASDTAAARSNR